MWLKFRSDSWFIMESGASSARVGPTLLNSRHFHSYPVPLRTNAAFIT